MGLLGKNQVENIDLKSKTPYLAQFLYFLFEMHKTISVLFDCSIRENICYAKADASEAEIVAACKEANAYDFIQKLPMQVLLVIMIIGFL